VIGKLEKLIEIWIKNLIKKKSIEVEKDTDHTSLA